MGNVQELRLYAGIRFSRNRAAGAIDFVVAGNVCQELGRAVWCSAYPVAVALRLLF